MADGFSAQDVFSVLAAADQENRANSPYNYLSEFATGMAPVIAAAAQKNGDTKTAIIGGLLSGLVSGGAGIATDRYVENQNQNTRDILARSLQGESLERPSGMSPSVFSKVDNLGKLFRGQQEIENQQRNFEVFQSDRKAQQEIQKKFFSDLNAAKTPQQRQLVLENYEAFGALPEGVNIDALKQQGNSAPLATNKVSVEDRTGPSLGVPSLREIENQLYQQNVEAGMPPVQAATSARAEIDGMRSRAKSLYGDGVGDRRERLTTLNEIVSKGEEGIAKAGNTGSKLASLYERGLDFLGVSDEASQQVYGDKLLDEVKQKGLSLNRVKGSGAVSDFEAKAMFGAGMGSDMTRSQNEAALQGLKNLQALETEYSNFMDYFMERTGASPDRAQTLWELYKNEAQILTKDPSGTLIVNPERIPWQQFDFESAYQNYMNGGAGVQPQSDMVEIRSSRTGEKRIVTREEAQRLGAL